MRVIAVATLALLIGFVFEGDEAHSSEQTNCGELDLMVCLLDTISWVEVTIEGDLLTDQRHEFEQLVRRRLRHELPGLNHKVKSPLEVAMEHKGYDRSSHEFRRRGRIACLVWTVGESTVAYLVECELHGLGHYGSADSSAASITKRILGYADTAEVRRRVDDAIRHAIYGIAHQFLTIRFVSN